MRLPIDYAASSSSLLTAMSGYATPEQIAAAQVKLAEAETALAEAEAIRTESVNKLFADLFDLGRIVDLCHAPIKINLVTQVGHIGFGQVGFHGQIDVDVGG